MTNCANAKDAWDLITDIQLLDWNGVAYLLDLIMQDIPENHDTEHLIRVQSGLWLLANHVSGQAQKQDKLLNELYFKLPDYPKS